MTEQITQLILTGTPGQVQTFLPKPAAGDFIGWVPAGYISRIGDEAGTFTSSVPAGQIQNPGVVGEIVG